MEQWNIGFWDNGMVGLENQNEYNCIDLLVIVAYFPGAKAENECVTGIAIKCRHNIFYRIDLFPLFIPSIPTFHYSIIPRGFPMWMATKNTIFLPPRRDRNSETLIHIRAKGKAEHVTSD
jgi:hypothetical protein